MSRTRKVLFVFTSANKTLTGAETGWYLPEAAHPYYILSPHFRIDFAAPHGPNPPVDPASVKMFKEDQKFLEDTTVVSKLQHAKRLAEINQAEYDAIFYVGGHGPVLDLAVDRSNMALASAFFQAGKATAAVCHGPAALIGAVDASQTSLFSGRHATAFSNEEEELADKVNDVPFLIEDKIKALGGIYEKAEGPWGVKVVVSDNLITGQNPASARGVGEAILSFLQQQHQ